MTPLIYWLLVVGLMLFIILSSLWGKGCFNSTRPAVSAFICGSICMFCLLFSSFNYWNSNSQFKDMNHTYAELQSTRDTPNMIWARKAVDYNREVEEIHACTNEPVVWVLSGYRKNIDWNSLKEIT